ncbi:MAG: phosphoribosylformylglycinamidine synthase [Anaerovoracaceae bacterium]|jgi:phosphoribosylformylglycinamidine synthase
MVRRIFVEKKKGFDVEAQGLCADIKDNLGISGIKSVRILNRYDIDGVDDELYEEVKTEVFAEPAVDRIYEENVDISDADYSFASEFLPGQYDQRSDSAAQCIQLISVGKKPEVKSARIVLLYGDITAEQGEEVKHYFINPVDSREASMEKPESLAVKTDVPPDVPEIRGFMNMSDQEIIDYRIRMDFAMSDEDLLFVRDYYNAEEHREPTLTELKVIDTYWSDHCRHTTFATRLSDVEFDKGRYSEIIEKAFERYLEIRKDVYGDAAETRDITLMDMGTIGTKYIKKLGLADDLDESEEINACSIKVTADVNGKPENWLVMFKNETHNHPTEIEPYGGAATCLGGAIRDPLSGRVYVYQAMRVTGSGDPRASIKDTLKGKLPQRKITTEAAHGYSAYGNQIGIATGKVAEVYDEGYIAKRMEVGAVIGAAPAENVVRKRPAPGDVVILVGGRTGRDGCGGATGSSKKHTEQSILTSGAEVQKGNPPVERNLQRLFRRKEISTLIKRCNDFGAGGVSVAVGELADSLEIFLDNVPKKYEGLDGTELAISESQERMAVVVDAADKDKFIGAAAEENLEAVVVAKVTDTGYVRMYWRGKCIFDLPRKFLDTNGVKQNMAVHVTDSTGFSKLYHDEDRDLMSLLDDLNCASQKGLTERFDSTIGAGSVLMPLGGRYQLSPAAGMSAKLPVLHGDTDTCTFMTYGFNPAVAKASPFHGAINAVVDSTTRIVAMGGDYRKARLSFQEYFEKLGDDPERWQLPFEALLGGVLAQAELKIPSIGGKDSMSGTFEHIDVPPTLISFAVAAGRTEDVLSTEFKKAGSYIVHVTAGHDENNVINFDQYRKNMAKVMELTSAGKVLAADIIETGGVFVTAVKMAAGNMIGADLSGSSAEALRNIDCGGILLEIDGSEDLGALFGDVPYIVAGKTTADKSIVAEGKTFSLGEIIEKWTAPLESVFPASAPHSDKPITSFECEDRTPSRKKHEPVFRTVYPGSTAKPRVFIPAFPGTNCEVDSARAFERAGALPIVQNITNLTTESLDRSIAEMVKNINNSQIIMIPGGFSGGDEPDGSAKFITAVFRNPAVSDAVMNLLDNRDGLILGICNGFQALIKLGLVPYGKITEMKDDSPTLTYNTIGRHASCLVRTRVASVHSPWMAGVNVGDIHLIPVSHGEGRFIADDKLIAQLAANGQIATQYVDPEGNPTSLTAYNPNNSVQAIEGIFSPDGRVFGKMGHSERTGRNLYKNVPGEMDQKLFESGTAYFR